MNLEGSRLIGTSAPDQRNDDLLLFQRIAPAVASERRVIARHAATVLVGSSP